MPAIYFYAKWKPQSETQTGQLAETRIPFFNSPLPTLLPAAALEFVCDGAPLCCSVQRHELAKVRILLTF